MEGKHLMSRSLYRLSSLVGKKAASLAPDSRRSLGHSTAGARL
jgi:hypothetical protein